ncbi:MAG: hypothetical protein HRU26_05220 [Psychroserpens sp.]|nr:hypothetical protein [Psychroserpens sp.]
MKNLKYIFLSAILLGFTACSDDDDSSSMDDVLPELTAGAADFSSFVTLGNSLSMSTT